MGTANGCDEKTPRQNPLSLVRGLRGHLRPSQRSQGKSCSPRAGNNGPRVVERRQPTPQPPELSAPPETQAVLRSIRWCVAEAKAASYLLESQEEAPGEPEIRGQDDKGES